MDSSREPKLYSKRPRLPIRKSGIEFLEKSRPTIESFDLPPRVFVKPSTRYIPISSGNRTHCVILTVRTIVSTSRRGSSNCLIIIIIMTRQRRTALVIFIDMVHERRRRQYCTLVISISIIKYRSNTTKLIFDAAIIPLR